MEFNKSFETAQEAAARLGVTVRAIQKQAAAGKIPGAKRHSRTWLIPSDYDPAVLKEQKAAGNGIPDVYQVSPFRQAMPLMNSAYPVGRVMEYINAMPDEDDRQIALAEYYFFSGQADKCAMTAEPYLDSHDPALRYSASLLCTFANLGRGHAHLARFAMGRLQEQVAAGFHADSPIRFHAMGVFTATTASVLLHLPTGKIPPLEGYLKYLPGGMKLYACYILAHKAYLEKNYEKCLNTAELSLALSPEMYPIATVYLHIVAAMALANMKRMDEARQHIDEAWKIAQPDDLIEAFGEHHGLLQGLIETYFKNNAPEYLDRILSITYAFSASWRRIHNPETGHDVADNLTTTEFAIAMLYNRGWSVKEIAAHMEISERTVNRYISSVYNKLGISDKNMLGQYMLK
ncbi:MAG: helix-turn-helix domain-containing protein [Clostridia bacterium]|nr:helix-turn-helix domain-containing protein [Clostridia bacterium]